MGGGDILATHVRQAVQRLNADSSGASAAEYALLLGIGGVSLALASITLGDQIMCSVDRSAALIAGDPVTGHQYGNSDPNGLAKGHRPNC